jgi:hypothetical protein
MYIHVFKKYLIETIVCWRFYLQVFVGICVCLGIVASNIYCVVFFALSVFVHCVCVYVWEGGKRVNGIPKVIHM